MMPAPIAEAAAPVAGGPRTPAKYTAPRRNVAPEVTPARIPVAWLAQDLVATALAVTINGNGRRRKTNAPAASRIRA
jgi:hypothetical protein